MQAPEGYLSRGYGPSCAPVRVTVGSVVLWYVLPCVFLAMSASGMGKTPDAGPMHNIGQASPETKWRSASSLTDLARGTKCQCGCCLFRLHVLCDATSGRRRWVVVVGTQSRGSGPSRRESAMRMKQCQRHWARRDGRIPSLGQAGLHSRTVPASETL